MSPKRQVREFAAPHGTVQIVELADGECQVGYLSTEPGSVWLHWGLGEGGYEATCDRFAIDPTFNPRGNDYCTCGEAFGKRNQGQRKCHYCLVGV